VDVRPSDEFASRLRAKGAINIPMAVFNGEAEGQAEVVQVFDLPGAVQRKAGMGSETGRGAKETVEASFQAAVGRKVPLDAPIVVYCNRAVDSTFVLLRLKGLGYCNARQVGQGMFRWRLAEMPTEEEPSLVDLPPANDDNEEALLMKLGYDQNGKPLGASVSAGQVEAALAGAASKVVVFSSPTCPFCREVISELTSSNIVHTVVNDAPRSELEGLTGRTSVPSVWVRTPGTCGKRDGARVGAWMHIGGCNDGPIPWQGAKPLVQNGDLAAMLA